jgi:PAS domain S-box-containing protein
MDHDPGPDELTALRRRVAELEAALDRAAPSGPASSVDAARLRRANRALGIVGSVHEAQQRASTPAEFFDAVCRVAVDAGGLALAWVGLVDDTPERNVVPVAHFGSGADYVSDLRIACGPGAFLGPTARAILGDRPVTVQRTGTDPTFAPWRELAARHGLASSGSLPLRAGGAVVGALVVYSTEEGTFQGEELEALEELARAVSFGYAALRDHAERKRAEENQRAAEGQARVAERRLDELGANVRDVFWEIDVRTGQVAYVSPAHRAFWGTDVDLADGRAILDRVHPEDRGRLEEAMTRAFGGEATRTEYRIVWPDGAERNVLDRAFPIRDERGAVVRVIGVGQDVTEDRRRELALRDSEARLRAMVDGGWDLVTLSDASSRARFVSASVTRVLGYTVEEFEALGPEALIHPDDLAAIAPAMATFFATPGQSATVTYRVQHKDGRWVWMEVAATNRLSDPALQAVVANARDVTARKLAAGELERLNADLEARVAQRTRELAALYEHAPAGYHSVDADGLVVRMNETELRWLGYAREAVVGVRRFEELVAPAHREALREELALLGAPPAAVELEVELERADESRLWVLLRATRDPDLPEATRMTAFDLTARRAAEKAVREREEAVRQSRDELSTANAALERAARAKDEFLAAMSHELRTPLNAILGLSEAFQEGVYGDANEAQARALHRIEESGRHLLSLINDILDLSKVEAGQRSLDLQPMVVDEVCRASLRLVQEAAQKKRLEVSYRIDDGLATMLADERTVKQILVNLLSNAVKFTPEGGSVGLDVTLSEEEETCTFSVWDTGIGIPEVDQARLFRPFVQLDSSLARRHAGTGLGLALVRRLVELHGGGIRVESEVERGSRFTFVVPWASATAAPAVPPPTDPPVDGPRRGAPRARVLLAEDDATNVALIADFFAVHGIDLTVARNGYEAITLANEKVPDLVLMDIQMPLLDGLAALRAIRQSPSEAVRRIPVIAVTALAMPGDRERCREAGADDYLTKPLRLRRLLDAIEARVPETTRLPRELAPR